MSVIFLNLDLPFAPALQDHQSTRERNQSAAAGCRIDLGQRRANGQSCGRGPDYK